MGKCIQRRTIQMQRAEGADMTGGEWWAETGAPCLAQCVLRVFKWVKSQLWLPDGGGFDLDHSDRPGLWCAAAYYWHYRETGIFLPNHFQLLRPAPAGHTRTMCMCPCINASVYMRVSLAVCVSLLRERMYLLCYTNRLRDLMTSTTCLFLFVHTCLISHKSCSINVHVHTRACGDPACLRLSSGCILTWFWMSSWHFIINPQFLMKSKGEDKRGEYNGFIYSEGRIPLEASILSGRLNIVQTDRQKGIIPPLPSPPTLPSKPSGSHFSVTTEEEDQRGKGAPLRSSLITLWPWDHPSTTPLQVSSFRPPPPPLLLFWGDCGEGWRVEEWIGTKFPSLSPKGRGMPRGRRFGIRFFVPLLGRAGLSPLGAAQGGIQSKVWRALQQTMVQTGDKVSPWWGICGEVQVSEVKNSLSGLTHLSPAAPLLSSLLLLSSLPLLPSLIKFLQTRASSDS